MNKFTVIIALAALSNFANAFSHQEVWEAATGGRWEEVRNAISGDPSAIDYAPIEGPGRGVSVLWVAAVQKRWDLVRAMLQNHPRANIDATPLEGRHRGVTFLSIAAAHKQWDLVRTMLENHPRANIDATPLEGRHRGMTTLWFVAHSQQWDLIRTMLQNNPHANIDAAPLEGLHRGKTILLFAAAYKQWDLVRTMLQNNATANIDASPQEGTDSGATVLWLAAAHRQWDLVRAMLQNNPTANIDAAPLGGYNRGKSVLWFAAAHEQWDLVRTMLQNNATANIDASPQEGTDSGATVLWFAAAHRQWDLVRAMLQNNPTANIDAAPLGGYNRGKSVLWFAAAQEQWDLVRTMLQNNATANIDASPQEGTDSGMTVLWFAAAYRQWDLVRAMLQNNPTANIDAAPLGGPNRGKSVLWFAATHQQWELIELMLNGDPNVLAKRAKAILSFGETTPSIRGAAFATLLLHADADLLASLTSDLSGELEMMRWEVKPVVQDCLRSWQSQDDSLLTHSLLPRDIQFQIALYTLRTHLSLNVPNHLLMPLLQAQLQNNNRKWLARETARQAFAQRFPFASLAPRTLDSPYCTANIEATAQVISAALSGDFKPDAFTRVEAVAFAKEAATRVAGLYELTPENIEAAVQNAKKRSSEEECPPAKRQICQQIKDPLKSRQGTRRTGERARFEEQEIVQDAEVSDPLLSALGLNRAAAIELILGAADDGAIRTLVATEIQMAALAHQLPSVMQAPLGLNADALREWAMRRDTFENYVAAVLGHQEGRIGYHFATVGLLGALAQLTHTHLTIWLPETDTQEVHQAYEAGGQGHRRIDLLHTNGMTDFTLLTPEQAVVPMAVDTMPAVRVATPTTPLSRSAALLPASPRGGAAAGDIGSQ